MSHEHLLGMDLVGILRGGGGAGDNEGPEDFADFIRLCDDLDLKALGPLEKFVKKEAKVA